MVCVYVCVNVVEKKNSAKQSNVVNEDTGGQQVEGPSEDEVQLDSSLEEVDDTSKALSPKKSLEETTVGEYFEKRNL